MADHRKRKPPLAAPKRTYKAEKPKPSVFAVLTSALKSRGTKPKKKPAAKKAPARKQRGGFLARFIRWIFRGIWWVFFRVSLICILILGGFVAYFYSQLPNSAGDLMDDRKRGSVTMLDHTGKVFAWRGDQFGGLVDARTVAPHLRNAVVATEDKRFYHHFGVSPRGIASAIRINMREGRHPLKGNGGSTITQQVAKRVYFSDWPTLKRKAAEIPMSIAMEIKYTKDEILTIYMNRAYLGAGSHGFEAAAKRYFNKSAKNVDIPEAAMLAGLLKAPSSTAPTRNINKAQNRANLIIGLMEDQGYLIAQEADNARANPARLSEVAKARAGGYFADWIMESGPEFILKDSTEDVVIRTTFDKRIQKAAEEGLTHVFDTKVRAGSKAQAAIVVMSPNGAVRAVVGGRKSGAAGSFNRATQALRQTGSSFKPFVYAAALNDGWRWDTTVVDERFTINVPGSGAYTPKNYTPGYKGPMTMTKALAKSVNTVAVKIAVAVGLDRVRAVANGFGIKSDLAAGPALALGASESTLLEMTGAYAGILNKGVSVEPYGVMELTIQGDSTPLMGQSDALGERIISEKAATQLVYMMNQVVETGTGKRAKIDGVQTAGKTGTTQGARDAWFIGFTSDYVVGVWMGNDNNAKLHDVTGGGLPAEIWREAMARIIEEKPAPLPMFVPPKIVPKPAAPKPATPKVQSGQKPVANDSVRDLIEQAEREAQQRSDQEAENVLDKVIGGIFGRKKN